MIWIAQKAILFLICILSQQGRTQYLEPKVADVFENESAKLTFIYDNAEKVTTWNIEPGNVLLGTVTYSASTNKCIPSDNLTDTTHFMVSCSTASISVEIKNVSRSQHGWIYRCRLKAAFYTSTLNVIVPPRSVYLTITSTGSSTADSEEITLEENSIIHLQCNSSYTRPDSNIKLYKRISNNQLLEFNIQNVSTKYLNDSDGLKETVNTYMFNVQKSMDNWTLHCNASNTDRPGVKSNEVVLNIHYPPLKCPAINNFQNDTSYLIIEGKQTELTCSIDKSNPLTILAWNCGNADSENSIAALNATTTSFHFKAYRTTKQECICLATYKNDTKIALINVVILYPPEEVKVTVSSQLSHENNKIIKVIEEDEIRLLCSAKSSPEPTVYSWSGLYVSNSRELQIISNRSKSGNITCTVSNVMTESLSNISTIGTNGSTYLLDVLYPPRVHSLPNLSIIEGNSTLVNCTINPGHPEEPTKIRWINSSENDSILSINKVNRLKSGLYTCVANNTMDTSYGDIRFGIDNQTFYLDVLYPPENITINSTIAPNYEVFYKISLIENTSLELICSAKGNPMPSIFSWFGLISTDGDRVRLHISKAHQGGNVTCLAKNLMTEKLPQHTTYEGTEEKTLFVDVLYPPEIEIIQKIKVIEGQEYNVNCLKTSGKTTSLSVEWSKDNNGTSLSLNSSINILNVSRSYAGRYGCFMQYKLEPTYGNIISGSSNNSFVLDVLYPPELLNISLEVDSVIDITRSVTVIENASLVLNCSSLGNPTPSNFTWTGHEINVPSATLLLKVTRNSRGNFTCTAINKMDLSNGTSIFGQTSQFFEIDVQYPPELKEERHITIPEGKDVTMTCIRDSGRTAGYAVRWISSNGTTIQEFDNLTLFNVTRSSSGNYTCETSYKMAPSYREPITEFKAKTVNLEVTYAINDKQNSPPAGGGNAGQVAGGVIGGLLGIGAVVAAVFLVRRRGYFRKARNDDGGHHEYQNVGFTGELKQSKRLPALPPEEESEDVHGDHRTLVQQQQQQDYDADEHPYLNTMELIDLMKKVNVSDLFSYVSNKSYQEFSDEFGKFPSGLMASIPCSIASRPQNAPLNRYQGIYPYDHSRVIISGQPDFFINASYIDGYSGEHQYIASLGPTVKHTLGFRTFWNMVWHQGSDVIAMLTNLQEPSGMKCEKYWADKGTTRNLGDFTIQSIDEEVAAEYKVRTFKVFKGDESRTVTQLHYTAWPDKKVPEDVTSLIEFRQRVKAAPTRSNGPLIVHCSAGVGRTGTYIALDRLIKEGKSKNAINVFDCVMNMRKQRVNMVQTLDQYVYLHQALVYCLVFDIEPVSSNGIDEYVKKTSNNVYSKLFQQLQQTVEDETLEEKEARAKNGDMLEKNRTTADIPSDAHRIRLFLDKQMGESDYINAVYLNGFKRQEHFIIAQSPLPTTLDDFVCLLYQATCCCIVSLDDYQQTGASNVTYLPPDNQPMKYGTFTISCSNLDVKSGYSVRKLKLGFTGKFGNGERIVYHFEFTGWKHDDRTPKDPKLFVDFIKEVDKYATELEDEHSHVLVHCMSGSERSGLFCAVYNLMDKMEQERQVSVVNMLRRVRARRRTAIPNMEQLKFCYQALNAFVKSYKI